MHLVLFCRTFTSCWNHGGNRHFLRGVARALVGRGHRVTVHEPQTDSSRLNGLHDGADVIGECAAVVPGVPVRPYDPDAVDLDMALADADVVLTDGHHDAGLLRRLGERRRAGGFRLLFHDAHHHSGPAADEIDGDLDDFDAVLTTTESLRETYAQRGWGRRAVTWRDAIDTLLFRPRLAREIDTDVIAIGHGQDGAQPRAVDRFLLGPMSALNLRTRVYDTRCPERLRRQPFGGVSYGGALPDLRAPEALAQARAVIDIPDPALPRTRAGIPTFATLAALACGVPLITAPWDDRERLFHAGSYLTAETGEEAAVATQLLLDEPALAAEMASVGLCSIHARHTCQHRVNELFALLADLDAPGPHPCVRRAERPAARMSSQSC